jgi:beta-ureidopropionase / N-carbamoyl-L-amino-acid hydrolase
VTTTNLSINADRLWASLMSLAQIGATPRGGVRRLALTEEDAKGRAWFVAEAEKIGLKVRADAIGNIFARLEGSEADLAIVVAGSHIDTQPSGGKFDGAYGVLAALEVARTLRETGRIPRRSLDVVAWTNEEGSRFLPVMSGSGVFAGVHALADVLAKTDADGIGFGGALDAIGAAGEAQMGFEIDAYFEAHIEQGPVLEAHDETIGVVTGALGQRWFECTLEGFEAHAGPTPMNLRRDALQAAASVISAVDQIGRSHGEARATVGMVDCWPNSRNTIPGRVTFSIDLRHAENAGLDAMEAAMHIAIATAESERWVKASVRQTNDWAACRFDADCVAHVAAATAARGYSHRHMVSGAGHDAVNIAKIAPTAMIFVPCRDGVSHNEIEDAAPSDLAAGANVLLDALLARLER